MQTELAKALVLARPHIRKAVKSRFNPHFKTSYADLADVDEAMQAAFSAHGLTYMQMPKTSMRDGAMWVDVTTIIIHESGQTIGSTLSMPVVKHDPQSIGSTITYARRFGLSSMAGVSTDDDDGESTVAPMTAEQLRTIRELIESTGADRDRFLAAANDACGTTAARVDDLPASAFSWCVGALQAKAKAAAK